MPAIFELLVQYGVLLVFVCVFLEQAGLPLPAYPVLVVAGSLALEGKLELAAVVSAAIAACLLADSMWYWLGARLGTRVLRTLCRISLSAEVCIRQTETIFRRWGAPSLLIAKFVPGFGSLATAMAGSSGIRRISFAAFDLAGSALWSGSALAVGWILGPAVHDFLRILADLGFWGLVATMAVVATFVLSKLWTRRKYATAMKRDGISIDDLLRLLRDGAPTVVDARATFGDGALHIPGAIQFNERTVREDFAGVAHDAVIVVYCDCPNEASAILVSRKLKARGFKFVRPLRGGLQSWLARAALQS